MGQEQQLASLRAPGIQWLYYWGCGRGCPAGNGPGLRGGGKKIGTKENKNYGKWNKKTASSQKQEESVEWEKKYTRKKEKKAYTL